MKVIQAIFFIFAVTLVSLRVEGKASAAESCEIIGSLAENGNKVDPEVQRKCAEEIAKQQKKRVDLYPKYGTEYRATCRVWLLVVCGTGCPEGEISQTRVEYRQPYVNGPKFTTRVGETKCVKLRDADVAILAQLEFLRMSPEIPQPNVQPPDGQTLANLKNIFYTRVTQQEVSAKLGGHDVTIRATPIMYHWDFGDGTTLDTENAGRPYPAMDVVHAYGQPGQVTIKMSVEFRGEFSVDGGPMQLIEGTITRESPGVPLLVREARAELVVPR